MKFINYLFTTTFLLLFLSSHAQVIFNEEFKDLGNPKGWPIGQEDWVAERSIQDNTYSISNFTYREFTFSFVEQYINTDHNFEISAAIASISSENSGVGVLFGYKDENNHQVLLITKSGYFRFGIKVNGIWSDIKNWEKFTSINSDSPAYNKINIVKEGNKIAFFFNDKFAYKTDFIPFAGKQIGFKVNSSQDVSFDFLRVRMLDNQKKIIPISKQVAVREGFSNNKNKWYVGSNDKLHVYFENGHYNLRLKKESLGWNTATNVNIDQSRDFEIKARILKKDGGKELNYGILFGMLDVSNYYLFNITGDGRYTVGKLEKGTATNFDGWKTSKAVNKYSTAISYNEFKIVKKGDTIYFYLNEIELYNHPFSNFFGNNIAFNINGKQEIAIDYLEISYFD